MSEASENPQWLYRIVGIRADDCRETLREALPIHEAVTAYMKLLGSTEFTAYQIERDQQ